MVETVVLNYLENKLGVPIYMEHPEHNEGQYVIVERTSASMNNRIMRGTFAFQSYGNSLLDCALLNTRLVEAMISIVELDSVSSSKLNTFYNFTDTSKKLYRYQAVFDLVYYD